MPALSGIVDGHGSLGCKSGCGGLEVQLLGTLPTVLKHSQQEPVQASLAAYVEDERIRTPTASVAGVDHSRPGVRWNRSRTSYGSL